jgi:hypothetical protein
VRLWWNFRADAKYHHRAAACTNATAPACLLQDRSAAVSAVFRNWFAFLWSWASPGIFRGSALIRSIVCSKESSSTVCKSTSCMLLIVIMNLSISVRKSLNASRDPQSESGVSQPKLHNSGKCGGKRRDWRDEVKDERRIPKNWVNRDFSEALRSTRRWPEESFWWNSQGRRWVVYLSFAFRISHFSLIGNR